MNDLPNAMNEAAKAFELLGKALNELNDLGYNWYEQEMLASDCIIDSSLNN